MAASESSTEPTTSQSAVSSAQIYQLLLNEQLGTTLKRKATDQNLEIITVDPHYDLTLIVGTLEHEHGQRALRVNRGSMRNVSDIWTKMLTGNWAERKKPEIELPDDSWEGLLLVLRMAHSQFAQLPDALSAGELWALAVLTDKYNLVEVVQIMLELKKWLVPYRTEWMKWPSHFHLQDFTEMTLIFGLDTDYEYLVHRLAVEVHVDKEEVCFIHGSGEERAKLRSSLPDRVLTITTDNPIHKRKTDATERF
ncbi:hypothetical protein N0V95_009779 [Ascochyta clinopodiicola]|nr:hypothetical protein N0V95_009779 [Ascochyta clinopodiicola]